MMSLYTSSYHFYTIRSIHFFMIRTRRAISLLKKFPVVIFHAGAQLAAIMQLNASSTICIADACINKLKLIYVCNLNLSLPARVM